LTQAEKEYLGFDHTEVGQHLAELWNLPHTLVLAIRYHHMPSPCRKPHPLIDCVHLGIHIATQQGLGLEVDRFYSEFDSEAFTRLGLQAEDLENLKEELLLTQKRYEDMFLELEAK
jgi:HD-like signal output (HDOD) protein